MTAVPAGDPMPLRRRAARLARFTIAYNAAEGVVAVLAGAAAGSVALVSFGLDSAVEVLSAVAVSWQFAGGGARAKERERRTLRLIAIAFLAFAAYVGYDSVRALVGGTHPDASPVGIGLAVASLVVMPVLATAKRRTGRALGSVSVVADSTQTVLCSYLSAVLLGGLVLNAAFGWGWADPLAGLVIAVVAVREGVAAWRGDACCAPPEALGDQAGVSHDACCAVSGEPGRPARATTDACCPPPEVLQSHEGAGHGDCGGGDCCAPQGAVGGGESTRRGGAGPVPIGLPGLPADP